MAKKGEENLTKTTLTVASETEHFSAQLYFHRASCNPRCQKQRINLVSVGIRLESIAQRSCRATCISLAPVKTQKKAKG